MERKEANAVNENHVGKPANHTTSQFPSRIKGKVAEGTLK